ncbi:MAG: hypothetical protein JSS72_12635 [Armatimonadetes bacterium]|nr:hypothetical protein [Armatimonadota bacterium]
MKTGVKPFVSYDIPDQYEPQIRQLAQAQHISADEALDRIIRAGLQHFVSRSKSTSKAKKDVPDISDIFANAPHCPSAFKSREQVDAYVNELRNEW